MIHTYSCYPISYSYQELCVPMCTKTKKIELDKAVRAAAGCGPRTPIAVDPRSPPPLGGPSPGK